MVDYLYAGLDKETVAKILGVSHKAVNRYILRVADKVGGHRHQPELLRVMVWRGSQIAVQEYLAGLRDEYGTLTMPRAFPTELPFHVHHSFLFPEDAP